MKALKIGFDAKRAVCNNTGLGNYSRFVIDSLSSEYPDNEYLLYTPRLRENPRLQPLLERKGISLRLPDTPSGRRFSSLWRSVGGVCRQMQRDKIDLYHGLSNELPLEIKSTGIASVVTIHDLIYRRVPEDYTFINRQLYDFKYRHAAQNATRVIAISERTKADLINDYAIPAEKIDVIYQGCHPVFYQPVTPAEIARARAEYRLPEKYIIAVGTVQSRKNQLIAVEALRALPQEVSLVIVGRRSGDYAKKIIDYIAANGLTDRVIWIEGAPLMQLPALYAGAVCSVYPSRYEGFGIPVIESIAAGTPVVAATGSCLEEAGGPGAMYIDLRNSDRADQLAAYCTDILRDNSLRANLVAVGQAYIKKFNPADFATLTFETYRRAIAENG